MLTQGGSTPTINSLRLAEEQEAPWVAEEQKKHEAREQ